MSSSKVSSTDLHTTAVNDEYQPTYFVNRLLLVEGEFVHVRINGTDAFIKEPTCANTFF